MLASHEDLTVSHPPSLLEQSRQYSLSMISIPTCLAPEGRDPPAGGADGGGPPAADAGRPATPAPPGPLPLVTEVREAAPTAAPVGPKGRLTTWYSGRVYVVTPPGSHNPVEQRRIGKPKIRG